MWWSPFLASVGLLNICKVQNVAAHCSGQGNEISVIPRHRSFSSPSSGPGNEATMCSFNWEFFSFFTTHISMLAVCNNGGRWSDSIYHVSDFNVYRYTEWGRIERAFFVHKFFVLKNKQQPLHFANVQNSNSWIDAARKGFNRAL